MSCAEIAFTRPHTFKAGDRVLLCFDLSPWLGGQATSISNLVSLLQIGGNELSMNAAIVQSPGFKERGGSRLVQAGKGVRVWYECTIPGRYLVDLKVVFDNGEELTLTQVVIVKPVA